MAEHKGNYRHGMYGTPTYKSWILNYGWSIEKTLTTKVGDRIG